MSRQANPAYHEKTTGPEILADFEGKRLDYWAALLDKHIYINIHIYIYISLSLSIYIYIYTHTYIYIYT